jgi:hypothetical protein
MLSAMVVAKAQQVSPVSQSAAFGSLGITAYERSDYGNAFLFLTTAVYDARVLDGTAFPDSWAAVYLARMYYTADGVAQDLPLACALYEVAARRNEAESGDPNSRAKFKRILGSDPCALIGGSSNDEVRALIQGCLLPGVVRVEFPLIGGLAIIDRLGVHTQIGDVRRDDHLPGFDNCESLTVPPITHTQLVVQYKSSVRTREFVHFFSWQSARRGDHIIRTIRWNLFELGAFGIRLGTIQRLGESIDTAYPTAASALELGDAAVIRQNDDGEVEWALARWKLHGVIH